MGLLAIIFLYFIISLVLVGVLEWVQEHLWHPGWYRQPLDHPSPQEIHILSCLSPAAESLSSLRVLQLPL